MTFELGPRSKVMAPNERPYMISYMSTIQMESPAHMVTEILQSFEKCIQKCIQKCIPTDRPTDRVRYRAAEAAKNSIGSLYLLLFVIYLQNKSILTFDLCL